VTAISYSDHPELWQTLELWADRTDDPRRWRNIVISSCQSDPKSFPAHERGQVKHVLRTVQGARLFSELEPRPHPEWICVLDANVRTGKPSKSYGEDPERFDPFEVYGLDDDLPNITEEERRQGVTNDHLLSWRDGDENPYESHRLDGRQMEGHEALPPRLSHLITWIGKSLDSPVLAWWAIRKNGLHPRLLRHIEWMVNDHESLDERARHIWNLIIEYQSDPRNRHFHGDWFDLRKRITSDGWSESVLRKFRQVVTPCLELKPPFGLGAAKPPASAWSDIRLGDLGQFDVKFLDRHKEKLDILDADLPRIFSILQEQFVLASGLLEDVETVYFKTPTCYPSRDVDGDEHVTSAADAFGWFRRLFDRLAILRPDLAKAHATTWDSQDPYFFRKLKLYAYGKTHVFEAD
jgi:hypothetical protein